MRRLTHAIVLAAFVFSLGGHWYILQGIAWVNMIREYSQVVPFTEAVSMTFSGRYPCAICKAIAEHKTSDQHKAFTLDTNEKKFPLPTATTILRPSASKIFYPEFVDALQLRSEAPPTPPPRSTLS
jgi:hypothetical protein